MIISLASENTGPPASLGRSADEFGAISDLRVPMAAAEQATP
jgi:hypothetical protein